MGFVRRRHVDLPAPGCLYRPNLTNSHQRQCRDKRVNIRCFRRFDDLLARNLTAVVTVGDVVGDADGEQDRFLDDDRHLRSQPLDVQLANVLPIYRLQ